MKKNISIIIVVIVLGIIIGGSFYSGMAYVKNQRNNSRNFQQGTGNIQGFGNRQQSGAGGFIMGNIISKDDKSITIKLRDGGSKIIFYSDTTEISKFISGNSNDLKTGKTVNINGKTNQDGSITVQSIQIR